MPRLDFPENLAEITPDHLRRLKSSPEGWFTDYKRDSTDTDEWAKDISAFLNSEGGYLFLGVTERVEGGGRDKKKMAEGFPGLSNDELVARLDAIGEAVSRRISPSPFIEKHVVRGPIPDLGLATDRSILVIRVTKGPWTPYVHISGRVYVRVDDESRPCKDRAELEALFARSREGDERLRQRLSYRPTWFHPASPRLLLFVMPTPGQRFYRRRLPYSEFTQALADGAGGELVHLPFDSIFSSPGGFTARQVANNSAASDVLTLRWGHDCALLGEIPLNIYDLSHGQLQLHSKKFGQEFTELLVEKKLYSHRVLDVNSLTKTIFALCRTYARLAEKSQFAGPIAAKALLLNSAKLIPFFSSRSYVDECKQWHIPIVRDAEMWCPIGDTRMDLVLEDSSSEADCGQAAVGVISQLLHYLGVLRELEPGAATRAILDGIDAMPPTGS